MKAEGSGTVARMCSPSDLEKRKLPRLSVLFAGKNNAIGATIMKSISKKSPLSPFWENMQLPVRYIKRKTTSSTNSFL